MGAVALFLVVFTLLAVQLAAGRDPALGAQAAAKQRPAVVKRVYVEPEEGYGDDAPQSYQPAPAPAPAPAPLQTRAS